MNDALEHLTGTPAPWLSNGSEKDADIAVTTRIRLARNIDNMPFPINADAESLHAIRDSVLDALRAQIRDFDSAWLTFHLRDLSGNDREILLERHLISREFINQPDSACLVTRKTEELGIMINEEDHLRIQTLQSGFRLHELWDRISHFDDVLSDRLPFAFDRTLGYLTSCPSNVGTGLRASVMLHLPALVLTGQDKQMLQAIGKLSLTVRGLYGEGSEITGNLFQISNQSTLGESEEQIIDRLQSVVGQLILSERITRSKLMDRQQPFLLNHIGRAFGKLKYAYLISAKEALDALSAIRLGLDLGLFTHLDQDTVNRLFLAIQPAHIQRFQDHELKQEEQDQLRASILRKALKGA